MIAPSPHTDILKKMHSYLIFDEERGCVRLAPACRHQNVQHSAFLHLLEGVVGEGQIRESSRGQEEHFAVFGGGGQIWNQRATVRGA
ncbi:hypothetical protein AVEN_48824-1 [Araneus ventricosus]|uniref:Uncharacterized protein n=1 Tax=Araneus ventricosus TaxID=182803 RepID=A0A4Y2X374_ARAVE|nr:hypothetical protein AVEN_48824-1 [Araneus ventricosus]